MMSLKIERYDPRFKQLVGNAFELDELFDQAIWAEGPAWNKDTQTLTFSDVKGNIMYQWSESNGTQIFRQPSHYANGNAIDLSGNLITCEHKRRGVSRTDVNGYFELLIDNLEGKQLNSPNDVVVKSDGTIWFTDPPYGILSDEEGKKSASEIIGCYVYCFDPKTKDLNIATFNVMRPNGLAFSTDEKQLFVAYMSIVEFKKGGLHHIVAFDVEGKFLTNRRNIAEINPGIPDGFCIDNQDVIYCSCENGIVVLLSDGTILGRIIIGKCTSNITFGDNQKTLFITATNSLYRLKIN
ncbi:MULTISPECIES: SMP-30/gluconolactonase/LRE family protein [Pasteurellaceae]|uniref:SMP-30/gluconolactonase/LRE family protein n=1 Tax=Pasteurella atlantica TaxID=2827233 RepID=A0AAW8CGC1_9PAST|nr:SMP-30/gluconolactonase/LRE family protein [Pasteurella atlantica]MBR0573118.1 SMP-30/gluconolactonase/LRE family protein [Pasteurella atlantica]MDP8039025.1 SMP-30/gluconolactonase/LRE family protein [Pasteurella atlantica]MDP8041115.1 SMP-30/gluconolactonase/LRE family protein [Pasteurella atlantica]MDP8043272.1 SMP-30/gluconolactonase/LRE family protein [Pasteurella atlantica]MDP8045358.1 SMP-30/gluconolactonase/LRE family protein [Pasteurella atlantica]